MHISFRLCVCAGERIELSDLILSKLKNENYVRVKNATKLRGIGVKFTSTSYEFHGYLRIHSINVD